jgi:hypothetical protein
MVKKYLETPKEVKLFETLETTHCLWCFFGVSKYMYKCHANTMHNYRLSKHTELNLVYRCMEMVFRQHIIMVFAWQLYMYFETPKKTP